MSAESEGAGEERSDDWAGILSDNIRGTSDSEELLVLSAIYYIIERSLCGPKAVSLNVLSTDFLIARYTRQF